MCCFEVFSVEESKSPVLQDHMPLCSRLTRLWFYIIYATAHRVKVSVLDQWWLSGRGFYCTCFFAFNEICQWQFDYLPPWKRKEQFEESLTFPLLSTITCSAFSIFCISSVQSAPYVPHKYLWFSENFTMNLYSLSLMEMKCACVCMCICCVPESDLLWISLTGRWASRQSPVCIFNKAERMHGKNDVVSLVCISLFFEEKGTRQRRRQRKRGTKVTLAWGIVILPPQCDADFKTLLPHSSHGTMELLCTVARINMPSSCINLPLNPKKCFSGKTWPRNVKWLRSSVLRWEEIMQRTNLLAEVINHKLFYSYSQSAG